MAFSGMVAGAVAAAAAAPASAAASVSTLVVPASASAPALVAAASAAAPASAAQPSDGAGAPSASRASSTQVDTSLAPSAPEPSSAPLTFAVSPFAGYRFGGAFTLAGTDTHVDVDNHAAYALALDVSADRQASQYELFYSRQSTSFGARSPVPAKLVVEYLHVGGTADLLDPSASRLQPYLIGSLGATRFSPGDGLGSRKTDFSLSIGAGVRTDLTHHLAVRLEARGFLTVLSASTAIFCRSDQTGGLCQIQARGSSFLQADILAGLSYAF